SAFNDRGAGAPIKPPRPPAISASSTCHLVAWINSPSGRDDEKSVSLRALAAGGADGSDMTDLDKSELAASMRSLYDRLPWYRRASARMGLQGKLVICFMSLL